MLKVIVEIDSGTMGLAEEMANRLGMTTKAYLTRCISRQLSSDEKRVDILVEDAEWEEIFT